MACSPLYAWCLHRGLNTSACGLRPTGCHYKQFKYKDISKKDLAGNSKHPYLYLTVLNDLSV